MRPIQLIRLAAATCLLMLSAGANAAVEIHIAGTTHAGSTAVPVGIPISGNFSFDETAPVQQLYAGAGFAGYLVPGTAQFTVAGVTHTYDLTQIFLNDTGAIVFGFANGADILNITEFTSNTDISGLPNANLLVGPLTFLVADFPNDSGVSVEVNAEVRAVPEPATWTMMLVGFAGLGLLMRRRQVAAFIPASASRS